ncbi:MULTISPECIES: hypothetical protein [Streptomyces]|uniref:DUF397 domain-containing protein n=1 Tax=Streptomyces violaceolatus TaxID=67378 RepID=A0ABN3SDT7_9ACTN|nr:MULTISPECIES: hypothetical protein [Streptomyces]WTC11947.1 hypothetical protein OHA15_30720 [Streptomyces anthocyanicus]MDX2926555.1 hypothetical protein [Streptomyces sp. NRRL_B-16638]MDX3348000.1 hypothetical protein [Streptomyces sp. ME02-6979A]MDX3397834.1 hypothetical protein [Streptomyces sp. ME01-18h]MDX3410641.1 hypothetical protein [Streptomyces sp. ME02-6977A]
MEFRHISSPSATRTATGDGDLIIFTPGTTADVYIALSNGKDAFVHGRKWHDFFGPAGETSP